jgi:hypothetical protein
MSTPGEARCGTHMAMAMALSVSHRFFRKAVAKGLMHKCIHIAGYIYETTSQINE